SATTRGSRQQCRRRKCGERKCSPWRTLRSSRAPTPGISERTFRANRAKCWPSPEACLRTSQNAGNAPNKGTTDLRSVECGLPKETFNRSNSEHSKTVVEAYYQASVEGRLREFARYLHPDFTTTAPNYLPWGGFHQGAAFFRRHWVKLMMSAGLGIMGALVDPVCPGGDCPLAMVVTH